MSSLILGGVAVAAVGAARTARWRDLGRQVVSSMAFFFLQPVCSGSRGGSEHPGSDFGVDVASVPQGVHQAEEDRLVRAPRQ